MLEQVTAALEQERLAYTQTETQLEAAIALAEERKTLRNEALAERDQLQVSLDQLRRESRELIEQHHRSLDELRAEHGQRIDAINHTLAQAQTQLTEQRGQLDTLNRENTNLSIVNDGLSSRIEKTRANLAVAEGRVLEMKTQLTACENERSVQQDTQVARLADKDQLITTLQQQLISGQKDEGV